MQVVLQHSNSTAHQVLNWHDADTAHQVCLPQAPLNPAAQASVQCNMPGKATHSLVRLLRTTWRAVCIAAIPSCSTRFVTELLEEQAQTLLFGKCTDMAADCR